jgi:hypothetical protein
MSEVVALGHDDVDIAYFAVDYAPGSLDRFPWGDTQFDCIIFAYEGYQDEDMAALVDVLMQTNNDWILTGGRDSERWHDYIDQRSVDLGRQQAVGDGNPMTAWFEEITDLAQWDTSHNLGAADHFLFALVGCHDFKAAIELLKSRIKEI